MATNKEKATQAEAGAKNKLSVLSARETSIAERKAGVAITTLEDPNALGKVDLLIALAWLVEKKENGITDTYEEYGDSHTLEEIVEILGLNEGE